jgi:hypothetical protein
LKPCCHASLWSTTWKYVSIYGHTFIVQTEKVKVEALSNLVTFLLVPCRIDSAHLIVEQIRWTEFSMMRRSLVTFSSFYSGLFFFLMKTFCSLHVGAFSETWQTKEKTDTWPCLLLNASHSAIVILQNNLKQKAEVLKLRCRWSRGTKTKIFRMVIPK